MAAATTETRLATVGGIEEITEEKGMHYAQNNLLSELPGLAFGLITVFYLVSSLLTMIH